jgi:hypothetical protein
MVPGYAHDLFLSYAHAEAQWVEAFKKAFCQEFHEREGRPVSVWQDSTDLRPGTKWTAELENGVRNAAAVLAIVSPAYQASPWCREERRFLLNHYGGLEGLKVEAIYRFLKIFKLPTERDLLAELQDVRFFSQTKEPYPIETPEFKVAITKAVTAIRELFRLMSNGHTSVYLATGAMEMEPDRTRLEDELTGHGYKVRPGFALNEDFGAETLAAELDPCSRAIFLLGGHHDPFVSQQIEQAIAFNKPCLFWIHPRLSLNATPEQQRLLQHLQDRRDLPAGSEILGGQSIPALWSALEPKLKDNPPKPAAATESTKPSVYLIFDATLSAESDAAAHLTGILNNRNLQVIQSKNFDDHQDLMHTSDAALLLRTTKPEPDDWWLRLLAQEVILSTRFASKALVLADTTRLKLTPGDIPVLPYSQPFSPQTLDPFIDKLQRARGAHAGGR